MKKRVVVAAILALLVLGAGKMLLKQKPSIAPSVRPVVETAQIKSPPAKLAPQSSRVASRVAQIVAPRRAAARESPGDRKRREARDECRNAVKTHEDLSESKTLLNSQWAPYAKILDQFADAQECLVSNPWAYFMQTDAFYELVHKLEQRHEKPPVAMAAQEILATLPPGVEADDKVHMVFLITAAVYPGVLDGPDAPEKWAAVIVHQPNLTELLFDLIDEVPNPANRRSYLAQMGMDAKVR